MLKAFILIEQPSTSSEVIQEYGKMVLGEVCKGWTWHGLSYRRMISMMAWSNNGRYHAWERFQGNLLHRLKRYKLPSRKV